MDPKTLRDIAEKTCIFDRAHFDDGNVPESETFLRHHETLKTDRKLITRLVPRYAVALGFFEGYAQAIEEREQRKHSIDASTKDAIVQMAVEYALQPSACAGKDSTIEATKPFVRNYLDSGNTETFPTNAPTAVACGFVRGFVRATEGREPTLSRDAVLMDLSRTRERISSLAAFANATEVRNTAAKLVQESIDRIANTPQEQNIGIVIRPPPPPPPPAAPPMPNEISDELAKAAANYANTEGGFMSGNRDVELARNVFTAKQKSGSTVWDSDVSAFMNGARWQLARTPVMPANEVQDAERAQYEKTIELQRARIAELESEGHVIHGKPFVEYLLDLLKAESHEGVIAAIERLQREKMEAEGLELPSVWNERIAQQRRKYEGEYAVLWADYKFLWGYLSAEVEKIGGPEYRHADTISSSERRVKSVELLQCVADASKKIAALESQLAATEVERIEMKKERDRALAQVRAWEERTGETKPRIVEAKLSAKMPTDREIVDFLKTSVYPHVQGWIEAERSIEKLNASEDELRREIPKRNASLAEACAIKLAMLHFMPQAKEESNGAVKLYVKDGKAMFQGSSGQVTEIGSPEGENEPAAPLVFRDESERDFWDEQALALNRRGDRTPSDVASAADEMVEERRKRMKMESDEAYRFRIDQIRTRKRMPIEDGNPETIDWKSQALDNMRLVADKDSFIERFRVELAKTLGEKETLSLGDALTIVANVKNASTEITDELLREAADYANDFCEEQPEDDDVRNARRAIECRQYSRWASTVRGYVNGALRKSRTES